MGRIGRFFKKGWDSVRSVGKKIIHVLPKVIDVGKKIVNNTDVQKYGSQIADKYGKGEQFRKATNFANDALNKASMVNNKVQQLTFGHSPHN